jgi:hypothetical protein
MLQGQPIQVKPVVEAAQRPFRNLLHAHTGSPDVDDCPERHSCKYNAHMYYLTGTCTDPHHAWGNCFAPPAQLLPLTVAAGAGCAAGAACD